jgi:hypothetical protein
MPVQPTQSASQPVGPGVPADEQRHRLLPVGEQRERDRAEQQPHDRHRTRPFAQAGRRVPGAQLGPGQPHAGADRDAPSTSRPHATTQGEAPASTATEIHRNAEPQTSASRRKSRPERARAPSSS